MICVACGRDAEKSAICARCNQPAALVARYELEKVLKRRGTGTTFKARDRETGQWVVVKELMLRATETLKEIELFEREAALLEDLDHSAIPRHLDHFELRHGKSVSLYNVQEFVGGESLEAYAGRHRFNEPEVLTIIADVAEILDYLRDREPVVVHRDIKPANLLRRPDGTIVLVDFGAARAVAETIHTAGSTVAGTYGYMAPEQLLGRTGPASDVYGLGATALRLLTARQAHELLGPDGRFDWRDRASVSASVADLIDAMTAVDPADRPSELDRLVERAREAADGSAKALVRYRPTGLVTTDANRPSVTQIARRVVRDPAGPYLVGLALFMCGYLLALLLMPALALNPLFIMYGIGPLVLAFFIHSPVRQLINSLRAAWLLQTGSKVRGIVIDRNNDGKKFGVTYRYEVSGEVFESKEAVGTDLYFDAAPGTEVEVFYRTQRPSRSTFHPETK